MSKVLDLVSHIIGGKNQNNLNLLTLIANKLGSRNIQKHPVLSRINHVRLFFFISLQTASWKRIDGHPKRSIQWPCQSQNSVSEPYCVITTYMSARVCLSMLANQVVSLEFLTFFRH